MNKRQNRLLAVLLAPAMLVLPTSHASAATATIDLERCLLTVHFLYEPDENRFVEEGYMPEGYTPASVANLAEPLDQLAARVEIWAFNCGAVGIGGGDPAPGMLTLTSIAIQGRPAHENWAGISDNYLFWAQTDRPDIANVLEVAGVPVSLVEGMTFGWRQGPLHPWEGPTRVQVPWATSPYALGVRGLPGTNTPHHHDNTFQHADPSRGKSSLKLNALLPPAQDLLCVPTDRQPGPDGWDGDPACGVKAEPGTKLARLLGDDPETAQFDPTTQTGAAADHDMLWKATISVHRS